ncbi:MAG: DNA-processing protein DprA [Coprococcus sp.]|nr:DNA-processing protein DprA [Coprococcus sp.]
MKEELLYLWIGMIEGISSGVLNRMIDYFGNVENLWKADEERLRAVVKEKYAAAIIKSRNPDKIEKYSYKLKERNISYIYPGHVYYPESLSHIPDPPRILYIRGNMSLLEERKNRKVAVVGARKASAYGMETAYQFSHAMAEKGITIVSGLASGIDSTAHKAALDAEGRTIGVLGCGINICYPRENKNLYDKICDEGLMISEYGLDVSPDAYRFPLRNRIISGLSKAVLVVEAREKSGSLITADQALEQGRDIYVIPGRISDVNSSGCNNLLKQGATCVTAPEDIIYDVISKDDFMDSGYAIFHDNRSSTKKNLAPDEKMVYSCVRLEQKHIDDICAELDMKVSDVVKLLFSLETKKLIRQVVRNYYVRC